VSALRLLVLDHDAAAVWRRIEEGEVACEPIAAATALAVWRSGFEVFHARVEPDEARALAAALAGDPLSRVCAAFERHEDPAAAAFAALASWLDEGWIAGIAAP
jgi:hypothetical protein